MGEARGFPYVPPREHPKPIVNSITVEQPFETVWSQAIPALGRSFFVINNMQKDSGFINLSYSGDASGVVHCGIVAPSCRPATLLEAGATTNCVSAPLTVQGRLNLVFEKVSEGTTRITVNVSYDAIVPFIDEEGHPLSAQAQFTTLRGGAFSAPGLAGASCVSTGSLETSLTQLLSSAASSAAPATRPPSPTVPPPAPSVAIAQEYGGIGAVLHTDSYARVVVQGVQPAGPADRAGVRTADIIIAIDGGPTAGMKLADVVAKARGIAKTSAARDARSARFCAQLRSRIGNIALARDARGSGSDLPRSVSPRYRCVR